MKVRKNTNIDTNTDVGTDIDVDTHVSTDADKRHKTCVETPLHADNEEDTYTYKARKCV